MFRKARGVDRVNSQRARDWFFLVSCKADMMREQNGGRFWRASPHGSPGAGMLPFGSMPRLCVSISTHPAAD
jgi:hypothetical protein